MNDSQILKKVGSVIRAERKRAGLSQEQLAVISGLDRTYIGGIERGERNPSVLTLYQIAKVLDTNVSTFFQETYD
jgi:transcriptional regulator with XRE-family HTH domain